MFAKIQKNVDQRVSDLTRSAEIASVVTVGEDLPRPDENAVDRVRETNGKARYAARESDLVAGLCDQVNVVGLYGKLHYTKPLAPCLGDSAAKGEEDQLLAKARQAL
jgi:hypothetical protein